MRRIVVFIALLCILSIAFSDADSNLTQALEDDNASDVSIPLTDENITTDENIVVQEPQYAAPSLSFVVPLQFEVLSGVSVVIVSLQNFFDITAHWISFGGIDYNGILAEQSLSADINTLQVSNGSYDINANVCEEQECYSRSVLVTVLNSLPQSDQNVLSDVTDENQLVQNPPQKENTVQVFSLRPSNYFSMLSLYDFENNLIDSGSEQVMAAQGTYSAKISFLDEWALRSISIDGLVVDSDATLYEINEISPADLVPARKWAEWIGAFYFSTKEDFSGSSADISVPQGAKSIFTCAQYDSTKSMCAVKWERFESAKGLSVISVLIISKDFAIGFASVSKSFKRFEVLSEKKMFRPDELPEFDIVINDELLLSRVAANKGTREFRAVLRGPGGESEIAQNLIEETGDGEFSIKLEGGRKFRPGIYKLALETQEEGELLSEEVEFAWGLISLNTRKSIYLPSETAEFEIVALDAGGKPVCGASLEMKITAPDAQNFAFSTENGSIVPGPECGLYNASYQTSAEGVYQISLTSSIAQGSFDTNFLVSGKYDFDIVRAAQSKLDPTKENLFSVSIKITALEGASMLEFREYVPSVFSVNSDAKVNEFGGVKELVWTRSVARGESATFEYTYSVPLDWPVLYLLGSAKIISDAGEFSEARPWYVAVDPSQTTAFHVTNEYDFVSTEPMPNDAASGDSFTGTSTQSIYGMHPVGPNVFGGDRKFPGTTTVGNYKGIIWVSPPLAAQTIPSGTWGLNVWSRESTTSGNYRLRASVMTWADANNAKSSNIKTFAGSPAELSTTMGKIAISMPNGPAVAINNGDKIIVEIDFNATSSTLATTWVDFNFNQSRYDGNIIAPGPITLQSGQTTSAFHVWRNQDKNYSSPAPTDAITGDSFTGSSISSIFFMSHTSPMGGLLKGPHKITGTTTVGNYKGVTWVSPPLAAQTISAGTWTFNMWAKELSTSDNLRLRVSVFGWNDSNDGVVGPIKMFNGPSGELSTSMAIRTDSMTNGNAITFAKKDKLVVEVDFNSTSSTLVTSRVDYNWNIIGPTVRDGNIIAPAAILLLAQQNVPQITIPSADANSGIALNTNFLVKSTASCDGNYYDCGATNVSIGWCSGAGCSTWADANSSSGAVQLVSGSNPATITSFNYGDINSDNTWILKVTQAGTYELRVCSDGTNTDSNCSTGTDRTIAVSGGSDDYSFTLSLPSSGCTQGKGSTDAGTSCDRGYFEPTSDLSGNTDENQVAPEGQTASIYFFVYDNQSSTSSDLNILLDVNESLPSTLVLKAGRTAGGYAGACSGNPDSGCILLTTTPASVGKATYSTGTQDLNVFLWSDFVNAPYTGSSIDRNVDSNSVAP